MQSVFVRRLRDGEDEDFCERGLSLKRDSCCFVHFERGEPFFRLLDRTALRRLRLPKGIKDSSVCFHVAL